MNGIKPKKECHQMQATRVVRFTEEEAREKLGRRVRALVEFSGVPMGTVGQVVDVYGTRTGTFDVVVEWNLPLRESPLRDRFAKEPYEHMLSENFNVNFAFA
jgi:hypothetical protein